VQEIAVRLNFKGKKNNGKLACSRRLLIPSSLEAASTECTQTTCYPKRTYPLWFLKNESEHPVYQPPAGQTTIWDGIIQFAGSETASQHGGYLEGALVSAERVLC